MPQWEADLEIGQELVRSLLSEQFPDLDAASRLERGCFAGLERAPVDAP